MGGQFHSTYLVDPGIACIPINFCHLEEIEMKIGPKWLQTFDACVFIHTYMCSIHTHADAMMNDVEDDER